MSHALHPEPSPMALTPVPQNAARIPAYGIRPPKQATAWTDGVICSLHDMSGNENMFGGGNLALRQNEAPQSNSFCGLSNRVATRQPSLEKPVRKKIFATISSLKLKPETGISFGWPLFGWAVSPQSKPPAVTALQPKNLSTTSASHCQIPKNTNEISLPAGSP